MKNVFNCTCLLVVFLCFYINAAIAQGVSSVNGHTGNVQINLSLTGNNLSLTDGNSVTLLSVWTLSGSDIYTNISGNVGIGTNSPDQKLTVKGAVHAKEVIVNLTVPGPDYVFEKNYLLLPIEDLKKFITQNRYLPEIPPAKEMETKGIELSEMNMLILKKVEEMSLYVIDHEKRLVQLEKIDLEKENKRLSTEIGTHKNK